MLKNQRGALFGLDARITLAILSGLSVVGGYSLVQKIGPAKYAALAKDLQNIDAAVRQMQADMRVFYFDAVESGQEFNALLDIKNGTDSTLLSAFSSRWQGPYLNLDSNNHSSYGTIRLIQAQADHTTACTYTADCYLWISIDSVEDKFLTNVNKIIDEKNGSASESAPASEGIIHYNTTTDVIYYRSVKRKG